MLKFQRTVSRQLAIIAIGLLLLPSVSWAEVTGARFDVTHEVVCECDCAGETQTYQWFPNYACSNYNDIDCSYGEPEPFSSTLQNCTRKSQPVDTIGALPAAMLGIDAEQYRRFAGRRSVNTRQSAGPAIPANGQMPYVSGGNQLDLPTAAEYLAWLNDMSATLFGGPYPGLALTETPGEVGVIFDGVTGMEAPFTLKVLSIQKEDTVEAYVEPTTSQVFDVDRVWLTGRIASAGASEKTGVLALTVTPVANRSLQITVIFPLGQAYPFSDGITAVVSEAGSEAGGDSASFGGIDLGLVEFAQAVNFFADEPDVCNGCVKNYNRDNKRIARDYESCLDWNFLSAGVGGLLGLFGGPVGAAAGASAGVLITTGICTDSAINKYNDAMKDLCRCLKENDCPPHPDCPDDEG